MDTRKLTTTEARKDLPKILEAAHYQSFRAVITRHGRPMAAVVSMEDLEAMQALEDMMDIQRAKESLEDARENGGTLTLDEFRDQLSRETA